MPTTMCLGRPQTFLQRPHHGVERIGDADDEGVGRVFLDAGADLLHHLEIDAEQIVAAHAGLARHAGGDDADSGALHRLVGIGAGEAGVEAVDRRGFGEVERLALGNALRDVEQDDVAELLEPIRWASVPPIWPAPISAILLRAMWRNSLIGQKEDDGLPAVLSPFGWPRSSAPACQHSGSGNCGSGRLRSRRFRPAEPAGRRIGRAPCGSAR